MLYDTIYQAIQMNEKKAKQSKNACPTSKNDQEEAESSLFQFDLLTINDRKSSYHDTDMQEHRQDLCCFPTICKSSAHTCKRYKMPQTKGKVICKREKEFEEDSKIVINRKRRIHYLQRKVQDLQKELAAVPRNHHYCLKCSQKLPDFYRQKIQEVIIAELPDPNVAGDFQKRRFSKETVQFEQIDFHSPLMQTQEMEQKMWIFLGTMLIAMGSKVMDFDGTINTFKVLKHSVDRIRRQVEKGEKSLGMEFFCCKQQLNQNGQLIDGVNFDPFFSVKEEVGLNSFQLQGVKMESVQQYELLYDYKYNFSIKYDAVLTIMQYARDHCMVS